MAKAKKVPVGARDGKARQSRSLGGDKAEPAPPAGKPDQDGADSVRLRREVSLAPEEAELLQAICRRDGLQPKDLLRQVVLEGLEKRRQPLAERPDVRRIMDLIKSYRSPLELRVEHWRYQDAQPALSDSTS